MCACTHALMCASGFVLEVNLTVFSCTQDYNLVKSH